MDEVLTWVQALAPVAAVIVAIWVFRRSEATSWSDAIDAKFDGIDAKFEGIREDIRGLTEICLRNEQKVINLEKSIDDHEEACKLRWERNWDDHKEMSDRIARLEGAKGD